MALDHHLLATAIGAVVIGVPFAAMILVSRYWIRSVDKHWQKAGWQTTRRGGNSTSVRSFGGVAVELVSENPVGPSASYHEVSTGRFTTHFTSYLRVGLDRTPGFGLELVERAALGEPGFFGSSLGGRFRARTPRVPTIGLPRLDVRYDLYTDNLHAALAFLRRLEPILATAPPLGVVELVGAELRIYLSMRAAGLVSANAAYETTAYAEALGEVLVSIRRSA